MSCDHYYFCEDTKEGIEVCMECGLVLKEQIFKSNSSNMSFSKNSIKRTKKKPTLKTRKKINQGHDIILNTCKRFHITDIIMIDAINTFDQMIREKNSKGASLDETAIAAYSLYRTCQIHNALRSKFEIASMFNISVKKLNKMESCFTKHESYIDTMLPSHLIPRIHFLQLHKIPYKVIRDLGLLADDFYRQVCATPNSILGYVLYEFFNSDHFLKYKKSICADELKSKSNNKKKKKAERRKISMSFVAEMCGISPSGIRRILSEKGKINFSNFGFK